MTVKMYGAFKNLLEGSLPKIGKEIDTKKQIKRHFLYLTLVFSSFYPTLSPAYF
jgi:hypothetical protein